MMRKIGLTVLLLFTLLYGCAPSQHSSTTLANQGILALSTSNPYLGTNLFLAGQAEKSTILYKFFQKRGGPTALELIEEPLSKPRMLLYYPKDKEVYAADLEKRDRVYEWIVRGPFGIQRQDFMTLQRMEQAIVGEPLFVIFGSEKRFRQPQVMQHQHTVLAPSIPLPLPTPTPVRKKAVKKTVPAETLPGIPNPADFSKLNSDQQAILISKGFVERADNGDAIHTVKGSSETVESITKWYTGATSAKKEIEALNSLSGEGPLPQGTRVRIPLKLLKNFKVMP
ncbi:MAG: hypothetical protein J5J00_05010 [Deltaproteobacteria bacterium]|nr:hypothetical protein [Deltaproteobacteria bacterium]